MASIVTLQRNTGVIFGQTSGTANAGIDTSHHLYTQSDSGRIWTPSLQSSNTTDQTDAASQSLTVLPTMFAPGTTIRCTCEGVFTGTLASVGLLFNLDFVSSDIRTIQWQGSPGSDTGTNIPFFAQCLCTVRTVGTGGTARGAMALSSQGTTGIINQVATAEVDSSLGITFNSTITTGLKFYVNGGINRTFTISSIIIEMLSP